MICGRVGCTGSRGTERCKLQVAHLAFVAVERARCRTWSFAPTSGRSPRRPWTPSTTPVTSEAPPNAAVRPRSPSHATRRSTSPARLPHPARCDPAVSASRSSGSPERRRTILFGPRTDEPERDRRTARKAGFDFWCVRIAGCPDRGPDRRPREPAGGGDLGRVEVQRLVRIGDRVETQHQRTRVRPRLARHIADVRDAYADLFEDLPCHRVLGRLPRLHEAG